MEERLAAPGIVTAEDLEGVRQRLHTDRASIVARNATTASGIRIAARNPEVPSEVGETFDLEIRQGEPTDQENTGRCWMFASLNTMRARLIKRLNLKTFELSQNYPLFFDKLEKANWFLNNMIDTAGVELDTRLIAFLLAAPVQDGGQWDMFRDLVLKYGVVPKEAMPETACSRKTREMDIYLTRYLRGCAKRIRTAFGEGATPQELEELRKLMIDDVYTILVTCLGEPPESFDVRLRDREGKLVLSGHYTPQGFFKDVIRMAVEDYISVISACTPDKPFFHAYTVSRLGNVQEQGGVRYVNLPMESLKRAAVAQLEDGLPVWFGCDVDQSFLRPDGVMDVHGIDVDDLFGIDIEECLDRGDRLMYGESAMTHAMVLEGVDFDDDGKPAFWKIENSWGKEHGRKGFDVCTDEWFSEYVYQVVVDKKYLTEEELAAYESDVIKLAPWDPMGSLAEFN